MIDREVLSAKNESAQVRYRRETEALQRASRRELARSKEVARSEAALWRELSRVHISPERPLAAHRTLVEARRLHAEATVELQVRSRATRHAESVRDHSREMLDTLKRRELLVKEGRQGEDELELALVARAHEARNRRDTNREYEHEVFRGAGCTEDAPQEATIRADGGRGSAETQAREPGVIVSAPDPHLEARLLEQVAVSSGSDAATLTVRCPGRSARGAVGLRVSQAEGQPVSVIVRVAEPNSLSAMLRERESIVRSLQDAGIEVGAVSFERGDFESADDTTASATTKRRARYGRDDETSIA